jgi:hypothetical protein
MRVRAGAGAVLDAIAAKRPAGEDEAWRTSGQTEPSALRARRLNESKIRGYRRRTRTRPDPRQQLILHECGPLRVATDPQAGLVHGLTAQAKEKTANHAIAET